MFVQLKLSANNLCLFSWSWVPTIYVCSVEAECQQSMFVQLKLSANNLCLFSWSWVPTIYVCSVEVECQQSMFVQLKLSANNLCLFIWLLSFLSPMWIHVAKILKMFYMFFFSSKFVNHFRVVLITYNLIQSYTFKAIRKIATRDRWLRHVCLSLHPSAWDNSAPTERVFIKFDIKYFLKICLGNSSLIKIRQRITRTIYKDLCTFMKIFRWIFHTMRNIGQNLAEKIKTQILRSITCPPTPIPTPQQIVCLRDNGKKYGKTREVTDMNIRVIWRMRLACWMNNATDTRSEYIVICAFPRRQRSCERAWLLCLHVHFLSCIGCPTRYLTRHFFNNRLAGGPLLRVATIRRTTDTHYRHIPLHFSHNERIPVQI